MQKNKNLLIGLGAVIIVIVALLAWQASQSNAPGVPGQSGLGTPPPPPPPPKSTLTPTTPVKKTTTATTKTNVSPTPQPSNVVLVTYTSSGFSPSLAEVKIGQVVRFQNNSGRALWVQTTNGVDAAHESAFNEGSSIYSGAHWDYVFTHQGTWSYANLDYPKDTGSVSVEPQNY